MPQSLLLSSNSLWNITNFRAALVRGLAGHGYRLVVAAPHGENEAGGFELSATLETIAIDRSGLNPLADLALLRSYRRLLLEVAPAAYLGWTIKPNIYGALAARWAGVPAILNVSGLGTAFLGSGTFSRFVGRLYRFAFSRAHVVFFQNRDDRDLFVKRRLVTAAQARLLPGSGIDLGRFPLTPMPAADQPTNFLLIARLLGDKGVREFVAAARLLRTSAPGVRCQLLGPIDPDNRTGVSRAELDGWIGKGVVDYLGSSDDVRPFIAAATAIVLPSYREGLPRTLLEGAAIGRPLIATDVPGCREVVEEGVNGLLCEVRSAASLAAAMARLAGLDAAELARMGRSSRSIVEQRFGEDRIVDAYIKALQEVVS